MRTWLSVTVVAALSIVLASADLTACGDKYIRLAGRLGPGYLAENPANVLLYMPEGSAVPAAARKLGLHDSFKRAGHHVFAITRQSDLDAALNARRYDIVVADAAAAQTLAPVLQRAPGHPTLLPLYDHMSSAELKQARREQRCLIASRERAYHAVAEIDHVMQLRKTAANAVP
jgi:hypothetical protein